MTGTPRDDLARFLRHELQAAADQGGDLPYEQVEAYVDGTLDDVEREIFETRLADDEALRQQVEDLRALRTALAPPEEAPARVVPFEPRPRPAARPAEPGSRRWVVPAGVAAAALLVFVLWRLLTPVPAPPAQAQRPSPSGPTPAGPGAEPPALEASLRDGGVVVGLARDGTLANFDYLPSDLRTKIAGALRDGRLPVSRVASGTLVRGGTLMSGEGGVAAFAPVSPRATAVSSPTPVFRWTAMAGATSYRVRIVDDRLASIAEGDAVTGLSWRPRAPLPLGRILLWQVEAATPDGPRIAPAPPQPEARFVVLPFAEAERVARAVAAVGGSDLAAATIYADAGLYADAEAALARLARENATSPLMRALEADLAARRRGESITAR
jgi:hypothetical protein